MRRLSRIAALGAVCAVISSCGGRADKHGPTSTSAGSDNAAPKPSDSAGAPATTAGSGGVTSTGGDNRGGATSSGGATSTGGAMSSGGAMTSGGLEASGGATMDPEELPEPPRDCTALSQYVADDACTYSFGCDDISFYTRCDLEKDDAWACQCATSTGAALIQELVLRGANARTACGAMAKACLTPPPAADYGCDRLDAYVSKDECVIRETCGKSRDLGHGVSARGGEPHSVRCTNPHNGRYSCQCQPQVVGADQLDVTADSLQDACEGVIDLCEQGLPDAAKPLACTNQPDPNIPTGESFCDAAWSCSAEVALPGAISATSQAKIRATCNDSDQTPGQQAYCTCNGDHSSLRLTVNGGLDDSCAAVVDACVGSTKLVPAGGATCTIASQQNQAHQCDAHLACTRPMKMGSLDTIAESELSLLCQQQTSGGPWWCSCAAQGQSQTFELGAASSAADACAAAVDECPQRFELDFGPHVYAPALGSPL